MTITSLRPQYVKFQWTDNHKTDGSCILRLLTYHVSETLIYQVHLTSHPRRYNPQHHHWHFSTIVNVFKYEHTHMHSFTDNQFPCQLWQIVSYYMWTYIFLLKWFCFTCDQSMSLKVQDTRLGGAYTFPLPETKWTPFCRRHFHTHFLEWKC